MKKSFKTLLYLVVFVFLAQLAYALNIVELSPGYYPNTSRSRALSIADIYVGKPDLDPEVVANQKTLSVQQEDGTITAVSQPIHTNAGGVPVYAGSPVVLLVEGDYSLKVLDSSGSQIYYVPSTAYEKYLVTGNYYYPDYSEADQGIAGGGETVTDILTEVGVTEKATMYFSHDSGGNTTTYTFTTPTTITDNFEIIIEEGAVFAGSPTIEKFVLLSHRSKFRWKDGDEIYIGAGAYQHIGTIPQIVYWNSELTFHLESTGSNASSDDYGADGWHYIYLDDSAIITQGTALLDADCFLNETTAPTYSTSAHGWYNGDDRCIFAVYETGGAILEFHHDGGEYVLRADFHSEIETSDIDNVWTDVDMVSSVPGFATKATISGRFKLKTDDGGVYLYWRTNGQTGGTGHVLASAERIGTDQFFPIGSTEVITDSAQIIEVKLSRSNDDTMSFGCDGWHFPNGM